MTLRPHVVGIAGPSCSGKSLLAGLLKQLMPEMVPVVVPLDAYYRDLSFLDPLQRERQNFDTPAAIEADLFRAHLDSLCNGEEIQAPVYDFVNHTRSPHRVTVRPAGLVIVEGLFVLYWEEIRRLLDIKIFVDIDDDIALTRRLERDAHQRGRSRESVIRQYTDSVQPMMAAYVRPTRRFADLIFSGSTPAAESAAIVAGQVAAFFSGNPPGAGPSWRTH